MRDYIVSYLSGSASSGYLYRVILTGIDNNEDAEKLVREIADDTLATQLGYEGSWNETFKSIIADCDVEIVKFVGCYVMSDSWDRS